MALLLWPAQRGRRWVAQLLAVSLLTAVFAVAPVAMKANKAFADTTGSTWEQPDPCDITPLIPGPNGEVLIDGSNCGRNDNDFLDVRSPDGSLVWSIPHQTNLIIRTDPVYDAADNAYLLVWDEVANTYTVYSYGPTGGLRWSQPMPAGDWYNGWIHGMAISSDGLLRVAGIATDGTVGIQTFGTDGTAKPALHIGWPDGSGAGNGVQLFAYPGGLVMVQYDQGYVVYLTNSGSVLHDYRVPNPSGQWSGWGSEYATAADGTIYLGGSSAPCGTAAQPEQIARVTLNGISWIDSVDATCSTTENPGLGIHKLAALPDGGVAIAQEVSSSGNAYAEVINADGGIRWKLNMPYPDGPTNGLVADVRADTSGHVVVLSSVNVPYGSGCNVASCQAGEVDTFNPASGTHLDGWLLIDPQGDAVSPGSVTINTGIAYVDVYDSTTGHPGDLIGGAQPDLGIEYPFGVVATANPGRYLALGDSIPFGHGLANPDTIPHGGLSPKQGPSSLAYPSLVATSLGYSFSLRDSGCTLSGDNLAVSGAPSTIANDHGNTDVCNSSLPHKAVSPDELDAANLATNPPSLVTIQVGADDVDFSNCLIWELTQGTVAASEAPGTQCVSNGSVTPQITTDLGIFTAALVQIVKTIEATSPTAKIVLVNYYNPLPPASLEVADGSYVCYLLMQHSNNQPYEDALVLQAALNGAIAQVQTALPEVSVADISHLFDGNEMCTAHPDVYSGDSSAFDSPDVDWRTAHPNEIGQLLIFEKVKAVIGSG